MKTTLGGLLLIFFGIIGIFIFPKYVLNSLAGIVPTAMIIGGIFMSYLAIGSKNKKDVIPALFLIFFGIIGSIYFFRDFLNFVAAAMPATLTIGGVLLMYASIFERKAHRNSDITKRVSIDKIPNTNKVFEQNLEKGIPLQIAKIKFVAATAILTSGVMFLVMVGLFILISPSESKRSSQGSIDCTYYFKAMKRAEYAYLHGGGTKREYMIARKWVECELSK